MNEVGSEMNRNIDNMDEVSPNISERNENICQSQMNAVIGTEHNLENLTVIDNSDDEPLLFIPRISNNRKCCSKYSFEIIIGSVVFIFIIIIIITGILFLKDSKRSISGCNKQSETGRFL